MDFKAIGFDFFGTIVDAKADGKACVLSMCNHLQQCGYEISDDDFIANYRSTTSEYRETRHEESCCMSYGRRGGSGRPAFRGYRLRERPT